MNFFHLRGFKFPRVFFSVEYTIEKNVYDLEATVENFVNL